MKSSDKQPPIANKSNILPPNKPYPFYFYLLIIANFLNINLENHHHIKNKSLTH
ncbi:hypothetical protein HMPREF1397_01631 [Helicobacter pylori GAM115Ai]|nr:hypothetical protein HMPREF1397_01631 [Helicobacter pylori GAM115Ai]